MLEKSVKNEDRRIVGFHSIIVDFKYYWGRSTYMQFYKGNRMDLWLYDRRAKTVNMWGVPNLSPGKYSFISDALKRCSPVIPGLLQIQHFFTFFP